MFFVAALGWLFDTMDQRIFLTTRRDATIELMGYVKDPKTDAIVKKGDQTLTAEEVAAANKLVVTWSGYATTVFMLGWATGGLVFGVLGDKWGRARTMLLTILIYSLFTGLSAFARNPTEFMIFRFITGLGVGGEFAAGVALLAETLPARVRPLALGSLQALSAVGNITGSLLGIWIGNWRYMYLVGTIPALMVVLVRGNLKEPDTWKKAAAEEESAEKAVEAGQAPAAAAKEMGSLKEMLGDPRWRRHTIIGLCLALAGVIGLWGVGFWSFELVSVALKGKSTEEVRFARSVGTALQDVGAFCGIYTFTFICTFVGRKAAFCFGYVMALFSVIFVFGFMKTEQDVYWMLPLLGFGTLSVFGGFAIYFPELYPVRLRSTGTGFCYNVARYVAAFAPFLLVYLIEVFKPMDLKILSSFGGSDEPFRYACIAVSGIFVLGL
ncbi:MAG: MFS transporter, partial [Planctomycetia bacterium]